MKLGLSSPAAFRGRPRSSRSPHRARRRRTIPELPDVQVFKEYVDATSLHRRIEGVEVDAERVLQDVSARSLAATLRGRTPASTRRHGKHLFVELEGGPERWMRLHFGMTGSLEAWRTEPPDALDHVRLRLDFGDGSHLAYRCPRRFGEVGLVETPDDFVRERGLGPDPWPEDFDADAFRRCLEGRRGMIKTTLMNQEVVAGLGNVYVDEILFQAGVHPERTVPDLDGEEVGRIHRVTGRVLRKAVEARARPERMPQRWLVPGREEGRACPRCDGTIEKLEVGGRPTYVCPDHQPPGGS